mmetsp:Transcript_26775/g.50361  ORF Transcript_26775/g.50361 Transcript_26775/m.50361 type:complete len:220 (+) Transcript_26775:65-724(+)
MSFLAPSVVPGHRPACPAGCQVWEAQQLPRAPPGHGLVLQVPQAIDHRYILAEAERKIKEVDAALQRQIAETDRRYEEERGGILQQAEHHTQLAEKHVASQAQERHAQLQRQEDIQAHAIGQAAEAEKARLGHAAAVAITARMEQQKAKVHHEATKAAEEMWRQSQRALIEKAHRAKLEIEAEAKHRTQDIEQQVREALSRIYLSPHTSTVGQRLMDPK